jgi:cold shock CspA family protein
MGRSQETFGKKEVRKKKEQKRKDKEKKRALRKSEGKKSSFDDMIAYVDHFGVITSVPPDPDKQTVVDVNSIELNNTKNSPESLHSFQRKGVVTNYNDSKGYGFIRDLESGRSIFVHVKNLLDPVKENNIVVFEAGKGPKGPTALNVKLFKEEQAG